MSASITAPRGLQTLNPSPEISRYYNKANAPYTNTAQVLNEVLLAVRYVGQTFLVVDEEWWFKDNITNLILKQDSGAGATNLTYTASPTQGTVESNTGTDAIIPLADSTNSGLLSPTEKVKIEDSATINDTTPSLTQTYSSEKSEDTFVKRSGTEVGKPIGGDLEVFAGFNLKTKNANEDDFNGLLIDESMVSIGARISTTDYSLIQVDGNGIIIYNNDLLSKGLVSDRLFNKQSDPNAFIQLGDIAQLEEDVFNLELNKANQDTTYTKTEVDAKVASVYKIRGSVANFASLPSSGQVSGDVWNLLDNGDNYAWVLDLNNTGVAGWDKLSGTVDLTAYETKVVAESKYLQIANALAVLLVGLVPISGTLEATDSIINGFGKIKKSISDIWIALGLKQDTLSDINFGTFTNSVATKNTQADTDILAYLDVTSGKWVKQTFSNLVDYLKGFFQTSRIIVTSNITAVNGSVYRNNGNNTYTDPTPVANKGFSVKVISGTATIGGVDFGIGTIIERDYDGTDWKNEVYVSAKNQVEFSGNKTVVTTWFGKEVTCVSSGVLTIPASLPDEFNFCLRADSGVSITWAITSPHTWRVMGLAVGIAPATMTAGQFCQVSRRKGTNEIRISGL